jgi:hypothetical protein
MGGGVAYNLDCNFTTYFDGSGNFNIGFVLTDGVPTLGAPVDSLDRYIANFDNQDSTALRDYIDASAHFDVSDDFMFCFWFQHRGTGATYESLLKMDNALGRVLAFERYDGTVDARCTFYVGDGTTTPSIFAEVPNLFDNSAHFMEVVKVGNSCEFKIDNVLVDTLDITGLQGSNVNWTRWGAQNSNRNINGYLWGVSVEVNTTPFYTWSLNEGSGSTVTDSTGNGNIGIITDGAPITFWDYYLPRSMEPLLGPIYNGPLLIGERDLVTKVFTPDAGTPTAALISDNWTVGTACVAVPGGGPVPPS